MNTRHYPVEPYGVALLCPICSDVDMVYTKFIPSVKDNSPFEHTCPKCSYTKCYDTKYPTVHFRPIVTNKEEDIRC